MVWVGGKEITMRRGWVVEYEDGDVIFEDEMSWRDLPNKKIARVFLKWERKMWSLDGKKHYTIPKHKGYVDVNAGGMYNEGIDSRTIGYYDTDNKCRVYMRVDETTGNMKLETEEF